MRLVEINARPQKWVLKNVSGGMLVQDADLRPLTDADLKVVTKRPPTPEEKRALLFAWKVCKHVKSNAILYVARRADGGRRRRTDEPRGFLPHRRA